MRRQVKNGNINKRAISVMVVLSLLLAGCGGSTDGDTPEGGSTGNGPSGPDPQRDLPALKSLNVPSVDFQIIQPSDFDLVAANQSALDTMAYKSQQDEKLMFEVVFETCEQCDAPIMPSVTRVFDINKKYTMFNMNNSTVAWHGKVYHGNYPVIMNKFTGQLYPIVVDGQPSEFDDELQNESPFLSQQKQGDLIPNSMLYSFDITDSQHWHMHGIYKAQIKDNAFVFETLKSDVYPDERDIQIDGQGNILTYYQDPPEYQLEHPHHYAYISRTGEFLELDYEDTYQRYDALRVIDRKLAGIDNAQPSYFSFVEPVGSQLVSTASQYQIEDAESSHVSTSKRSPQIDGYDMNIACIVNRLDEDSYDYVGQSALISADRPYSSFDALRAAQHTLFCVDYIESWQTPGVTVKVSAFDTDTEQFYEFDTGIELYGEFASHSPDGGLTANDGVVVQSDQTVMLYMNRINSNEVVEFYINPIAHTVKQKVNDGFISPIGFASLSDLGLNKPN
ncbi:hypothetical protein [Vibrio ostreicida]|uniref:hypothetical protein n=1 Tax=Vibrio ostreicida TaxID=526588 RepID=UPI0009712F22|nr:hypothetical protein [Vibrio ostreicida]